MDTAAADAAKQTTAKAVLPLRCEFRDHGYDAGFEVFVFERDKPIRIYAAHLNTNAINDAKALAKELNTARRVIAGKGHTLDSWTPTEVTAYRGFEISSTSYQVAKGHAPRVVVSKERGALRKETQLPDSEEVFHSQEKAIAGGIERGKAAIDGHVPGIDLWKL